MIALDAAAIAALRSRGVSTLHAPGFQIAPGCLFEPPCSLKWMQIAYPSELGAFSYAVSGYYFAVRIGRYVSIGEDVQIGRHSHPTDWASTSPVFYQPAAAVFDREVPEAAGISPADFMGDHPHPPVRTTVIGHDVWIGHGAFISPGIRIGDGAVIGARAVVTRDVPPYAVVAGVPATVRKLRLPEATVARMGRTRWWRYAPWQLAGAPLTDPDRFLDHVDAMAERGEPAYEPGLVRPEDAIAPARAA